jgi:uncharacterized protein involved in exopolysaccharide biosynthesis
MNPQQDMPSSPVLSSSLEEDEISLLDLAQVVVDHLQLLVLGPLAAGIVALGVSFLITPVFTAKTQFLPPQQQQSAAAAALQSLGALGGLAGAATGIKNPNDQYVSILKSRVLSDQMIERFKLMQRFEAEYLDDARKSLEGVVRIQAGKDNLISIEVEDHDPAFAAEMANAYVEEFRLLLGRLALTEAQQRRLFFERQLEQTRLNLTQAEEALRGSGVSSASLKNAPEVAIGAVAQLQAQIAAQEVKLGSMRGYLAETAPDFRQAQNELAALRQQLTKLERASTDQRQDADGYVARYRTFKYHETLFELFAKQYELARADEAREGNVIQVVDVAVPPNRKSKPKKALIAVLATLAMGFVLLLWVFVRQALRNAATQPDTADKLQALKAGLRKAWPRR